MAIVALVFTGRACHRVTDILCLAGVITDIAVDQNAGMFALSIKVDGEGTFGSARAATAVVRVEIAIVATLIVLHSVVATCLRVCLPRKRERNETQHDQVMEPASGSSAGDHQADKRRGLCRSRTCPRRCFHLIVADRPSQQDNGTSL